MTLARHGAATMLRVGHHVVTAAGLSDALVAIRGGMNGAAIDDGSALFHDEELDGPLPSRLRTLVLATRDDQHALTTRLRGFDDVDVISSEDVPDAVSAGPGGRTEQQLALLALRLEMAAVYVRLVRG